MNELEDFRRKRLEELQRQQQEVQQLQQQIEALENYVKQNMTSEALSRYGNLKSAHPEKAVQVLGLLGQMLQAGRLDLINDDLLLSLLRQLQPPKKEFKVTRK
ncbi:hypothetical protein KY330_04900 [Candidatus Woesearchaeota archaeon]|nr:hypothetical protein [Candidatus Woesearchaeota archaeon]